MSSEVLRYLQDLFTRLISNDHTKLGHYCWPLRDVWQFMLSKKSKIEKNRNSLKNCLKYDNVDLIGGVSSPRNEFQSKAH